MRTTVTIDDDIAIRLETLRRERGLTFKEALNQALRAGLTGSRRRTPFRQQTFSMGIRPGINLDKALQLDAELEDEEIIRKLKLHK
jgi:hypothetical protein